ncbi:Protein-tyrosine sulfotransferase [Paragonimus heterotremus]|uniref:Protein-tyrosine sulfotransferase n=1 Tax=Paragonimus heterotremus TaxID=100268 RepID=A0A8J4SP70_9TREM|nr:Protein-tyrosine sulfotransferase [Paragonimus heterotremus]
MRILSAYFNQRISVRIFHIFLYLFPLVVVVKLLLREPTRCDNDNRDNYSLVFVGGYPRSGTTLIRVMLDVHPMVRCGPETVVIPKMLHHLNLLQTVSERRRLVQAHLYPKAIYASFAAFIRSLVEHAGEPAPVLCNKDPFSLVHMKLLSELFPTAKFINMVRDGRAVVASIIKRKVRLAVRNYSHEEHMDRWANVTWKILEQCDVLGPTTCRTVFYEKLVLRPRENMQAILGNVLFRVFNCERFFKDFYFCETNT